MRRIIAVALLLAAFLPHAVVHPAAAAETGDLAILSADIQSGNSLTGACYIIESASEEGCDENGDGKVTFKGVPVGTFTVTQTKTPSGYLAVGDFPITVQVGPNQVFGAFLAKSSLGGGSIDIDLRALDGFSNDVLTGACFQLYGGSEVGCDENNDGKVTFQGVRAGTYLTIQTQPPAGHIAPDPFWVTVTATSPKSISIHTPEDIDGTGVPNVSILSVDADSGALLKGACYIIQGGSIEGCDENGDGQVDYRGVAPGTYSVTQTKSPSGYATADDFTIVVSAVSQRSFTAYLQAKSGSQPNLQLVDVGIVSRDAETGDRLTGACYIILDYSNEGCDENVDGQVDFADIPAGRYAVLETRAPDGYQARQNLQFLIAQPIGGGRQFLFVDHQRE